MTAPRPLLAIHAMRLGDDALILGQRMSEWCGHAPALEVDLSLANIALDLIGQATLFLGVAGEAEGMGRDCDRLAFHRDVMDFTNCLLVEQPNGDFAHTIARQFLFSHYQDLMLAQLRTSRCEPLAAIAGKAAKEVSYHARLASDWVVRLGDGTVESHRRMVDGLDWMWRFTDELFEMDEVETALSAEGFAPDKARLRPLWDQRIDAVLAEATLRRPAPGRGTTGGRAGRHSEQLGHLLATMQFLPRAYPGVSW